MMNTPDIFHIYIYGPFKRYCTSHIRPFLLSFSMVDDSIAQYKIENRHVKTGNKPGEPELYCDNVQDNVDQQSYGKQSIPNGSRNVTKK